MNEFFFSFVHVPFIIRSSYSGPIPTRKKQELGRKKKRKNPFKIFTSIFTNSVSQLLFLQIKFESEKRKKRKKKELGAKILDPHF